MSTDVDILSHFGGLDELIQVVYQGFDRFVVLSTVGESSWSVYVGLKGPEGRWWRGSWTARDVTQFIGSRSDPKTLERFAHNLSETFVNGEVSIGGWDPPDSERGQNINLTVGRESKKPVQIPLVELSAKQAASHATAVFSAIAISAQSRQCRLNPPAFSAQASVVSGPLRARRVSGTEPVDRGDSSGSTHVSRPTEDEADAARHKIETLQAELAQVKATKGKSPSPLEPEPKKSAVCPPKGASLANPHKKARGYREVEFGSDDE